jgi:hypothetical protein
MSKLLIVAASLFCIIGATVAYAQQCKMWQCTNIGNMQQCICVGY